MQRTFIPQRPEQVTPVWLTEVLRRSGVLDENTSVIEAELSDPGREASYAGYVSRISLTFSSSVDCLPHTMILKLPAPERLIRRLFRSIYRNETLFYREIAESSAIPVPKCYVALINRSRTRSLLLLEDLTAFARPGDHDSGCTDQQAEVALGRLAGLHADWWEHPALDEIPWLSRYRVDSRKNWLIYAGAWAPFQFRLRDVTPPETLRLYRDLWRYRRRLLELEHGRPHSLQHGDYRLANLAFSDDDVYVFDWQVVRAGPPMFDVAWFILTSLDIEQRRRIEADLLRGYHAALVDSGIVDYTFEELIADYRFALLLTIPQIMVIGGFLRVDPSRRVLLGELLNRFDAARRDHELIDLLER
jgi:hypothetical protein